MSAAAGTLVIFDCDGVLVDSERLVVDIDVAACHRSRLADDRASR